MSNAALRSSSTNREIQPRSDDKCRLFVTLMRAVSVLYDGINPDWIYLRRNIIVSILPFLVFLTEKGDSRSVFN